MSDVKRVKDQRYLYRRGDQFYFRRKVPLHAHTAFCGRAEIQKSLGTTGLKDARHLLAIEVAKFEKQVDELAGRDSHPSVERIATAELPSEQEIEERVRQWLDARMARASEMSFSDAASVSEASDRLASLGTQAAAVAQGISLGATGGALSTTWAAEAILDETGWAIEQGSPLWRHLVRVIGRGQIEANGWLAQDINGDPRTITDVRFSPEQYRLDAERAKERRAGAPVSLNTLLDDYCREAKPAPATIKAWTRQVKAFTDFLGHDDAHQVKLADVVRWKEKLLSEPNARGKVLSVKTVRDTYLAVLKTVFSWVSENGIVDDNPAASVRIAGRRKGKARNAGLKNEQAQLILAATVLPVSPHLSRERAFAQRWVPWLCAYSGARVNEITQMRAEDVMCIEGVWAIRITPEAGSVKDGNERTVALHPHLIEQGFVEAVRGRKGPIFYDPALHRGGGDGHPQYKKVGEHLARWVRGLGLTDPNLQPNHGWRHRFKSVAREVNMDWETREFIQGHATRTEGEAYGDHSVGVTLREIEKLPRYEVPGCERKANRRRSATVQPVAPNGLIDPATAAS